MFMKIRIGRVKRICYGYFKRCPDCEYSGSDWGDSGECSSCGETS